jgi:hypothetical protein
MYIYNIGYGTMEESNYFQYSHTNKFSEEQLRKMVEDGLFEASIIKDKDWTCFLTRIEDLTDCKIFRNYLESKGFIRVKFEAQVSLFGWNDLKDKIWERETEPWEKKMISNLKQRLTIHKKKK